MWSGVWSCGERRAEFQFLLDYLRPESPDRQRFTVDGCTVHGVSTCCSMVVWWCSGGILYMQYHTMRIMFRELESGEGCRNGSWWEWRRDVLGRLVAWTVHAYPVCSEVSVTSTSTSTSKTGRGREKDRKEIERYSMTVGGDDDKSAA